MNNEEDIEFQLNWTAAASRYATYDGLCNKVLAKAADLWRRDKVDCANELKAFYKSEMEPELKKLRSELQEFIRKDEENRKP